jgi:TRAP-type C4-dicarboxylate transport system substrate-binding protein
VGRKLRHRSSNRRALAGAAVVLLAGCTAGAHDSSTIDKAGGASAAITIRVGTENEPGRPENDPLRTLGDEVARRSGGSMKVQLVDNLELVSDPPRPTTALAAVDGTVDMALTGASSWGNLGATSMQALQAPFVVRSRDQALRFLQDRQLVADLLSGLRPAGVVGVGLIPEDFRLLVDYRKALTSPVDLTGQSIRLRVSTELAAFYRSLGLTIDVWGNTTDLREFTVDAQNFIRLGTVVGNLPVYFRFGTLVANPKFWSKLSSEQHQILRDAADAATTYAVAHRTQERSAASISAYCARGGTVNTLTAEQVAGFVAAAKPTIETMRRDPLTARALETLAKLGVGAAPSTYPPCGSVPTTIMGAFPEGVYRFEITMDDLTPYGPQATPENVGIYTYTIKNGKFQWTQQPGQAITTATSGEGTYTVDGNQVTMTEPGGDPLVMTPTVLRWTVDDKHALHFAIISSTLEYVKWTYGEPWIRIGDAP